MNMQSPGNKILLWLVILVLVMACAPAMATPAPTLAPDAISTLIMQTAAAASTQTIAAVPAFTATATFTVTPPSTFTPESTFTAVGVFLFPTPTPITRKQYFRVKHDSQLEIYNYMSRTGDKNWNGAGPQTPETVRLLLAPKSTSDTVRAEMVGSWNTFLDALNDNNKQKLRYLKAEDTGLFNHAGYPMLESLTMGGNLISLDEIQGAWGLVNTMDYATSSITTKEINYVTRPDLVHKFVVVVWSQSTNSTYWVNPPPGEIYFPLVTKRAVWVPLENLEPFPSLPMIVTANATQTIRKKPAKDAFKTGFELAKGESASVVEYYPTASDVWGRLAGGGWIALLIHDKSLPVYPTSWSMATRPPP